MLKVALLSGLAVTLASCSTVQGMLPFGLGRDNSPQATATDGQRISVLEFEQALVPSAALSGRDFFIPGPQAAIAWTPPGGNAENAVEHVIAGAEFTVAWRRGVGAGSSRTRQVMAPVVADNGRVFVLDGESTVSALDAGTGAQAWRVNIKPAEDSRRTGFLGMGGRSDGGGFGGGVAVGGGNVFVSSGYRTVTAIDQASGAVIWTTPVDVPIHGAPTVSGGRVFVVDVENQIQAFDTTTGAQDWSYRGIPEPARIRRDRIKGAGFYCVQDDAVSGVGAAGYKGQRSPLNLLSGTLADELERVTDGRSKTIGVAMKDRGSILPIGRTGDAAYWFFEGTDGYFATSTWYMNTLPPWLQEFNARGLSKKYLQEQWALLLPVERYHIGMPDDNVYEEPLAGSAKATLPMDVKAMYEAAGRSTVLLRFIPAGLTYSTDMALAALDGEGLGQAEHTDLLAISYSAPDELGHEVGPRSFELEDMYLRLDRELERRFQALDQQVGKVNYTVFQTADHAVVDVPSYLRDQQASAGYVDVQEVVDLVNQKLGERYGSGTWVRKRIKEQLFLNDSLITAKKLVPADVQRAAADILLGHPSIADAVTAADLARTSYASGIRKNIQRGYMPMRSGDVCYVLRPSHLASYSNSGQRGTDHSSAWTYDTHAPVLMMGLVSGRAKWYGAHPSRT